VDGPPLFRLQRSLVVNGFAEEVENPSQRLFADRNRDWCAGINYFGAALDAVRGSHGNCTDPVPAKVLLNLAHHFPFFAHDFKFKNKSIINFR